MRCKLARLLTGLTGVLIIVFALLFAWVQQR
jgi:hypothetical protein